MKINDEQLNRNLDVEVIPRTGPKSALFPQLGKLLGDDLPT
jgi:hypothetical protein